MENVRIPLLDHGYLQEIEHWGSDESIVAAARMSTGKGFLRWDEGTCPVCGAVESETAGPGCQACEGKGTVRGDMHLLRRLWTMKHATPFEMAGLVIEVQAPIFVFREWHRHRTQSFNEMSARYVPLPAVNYIPSVERLLINSKTNKQAGTIRGAAELTVDNAEEFCEALQESYADSESLYQWALERGVPKELARIHLPVGRYSRMRASTNLRNWLAFLTLRMDEGAQWEIRQYANAVGEIIAKKFPRTWELFAEGRK
jgi:thymidylate synthase (FAD)